MDKVRYQEIQLGQDSSWKLDEVQITVKLERSLTASDAADYVIKELQQHLDEAQSWNPPTFNDLERLAARLRRLADYAADQDWSSDDRWATARYAIPEVISGLWTAAQVAATSIALGAAIASAKRKWRQPTLPRGSRLTLTITPAKDDDQRRRSVRMVIYDIHAKSAKEITDEIRDTLNKYKEGDDESRTRPRMLHRGRHRAGE